MGATSFERWLNCIVAASGEREGGAGEEVPALGVQVDDAGCPVAKLRRQRARKDRGTVDEPCVEFLAEAAEALRQEHIVQAVLEVGVFAPQVQLAEGILRHTGNTQDHLVEAGGSAERLDLDLLTVDLERRRPEARHDVLSGAVEFVGNDKAVELDYLAVVGLGGGISGWRCIGGSAGQTGWGVGEGQNGTGEGEKFHDGIVDGLSRAGIRAHLRMAGALANSAASHRQRARTGLSELADPGQAATNPGWIWPA